MTSQNLLELFLRSAFSFDEMWFFDLELGRFRKAFGGPAKGLFVGQHDN